MPKQTKQIDKTSSDISPKDDGSKTIAIKVDARLHDTVKKLAKFKGMKIQDVGHEALTEWIEYVVENDVKDMVSDLRARIRAGNEIIKTK